MLKIALKPHRTSLKAGQSDEQKIYALLKLIPTADVAQARPPLAICMVIDTSASMQAYVDQDEAVRVAAQQGVSGQAVGTDGGNYKSFNLGLPTLLDQAIQAAHMLVDDPRLAPTDTVSIVHFDDNAQTLLPLTPVAHKAAIHSAIESLRNFAGATHMAKGLRCALAEMGRLGPEVAKRAFVLTDGETFDEEECLSLLPHLAATNAPIIAIGFGEEYNEKLLRQMADATQGRPYHLRQMVDLMNDVLPAEVGQTAREVVTDLKMNVATVKGVQIDSVSRVYPAMNDVNLSERPYRLGNIAAGDYTAFIVELTVSGVERPPSRVRIAQFGLAANAPGLGQMQEFPPENLFVEFTNDESAIALVDPEVIGYVQQKNVGRMVDEAVRTVGVDVAKARQTLQVAAGMTRRVGNSAMTMVLNDAINELDRQGTISVGTVKTVALGLRTKTVKTAILESGDTGGLSPDEIRRLTGT